MNSTSWRLEYRDTGRCCADWVTFEERKEGFSALQYAINYRKALMESTSKKWEDYVWRIVEVRVIETVVNESDLNVPQTNSENP